MPPPRMTRDLAVSLLLALPLLGYLAGAVWDVRRLGQVPFSRVDALALGLVIGYAVVLTCVRESGLRKKLALSVYSLLLPVSLFEMAAWTVGLRDLPWTPQQRRFQVTAPDLPGLSGEVRFTTTWFGVRAPDIWPANREDRILCLGGSTTECLYVSDEDTWPWKLGTLLTEHRGGPVLVANAGRSGHFTGHHHFQLQHYRYAAEFGTVIVLCGINDMAAFRRGNRREVERRAPNEALMLPHKKASWVRGTMLAGLIDGIWRTSTINPSHSVLQDFGADWIVQGKKRRQELLAAGPLDQPPEGLAGALRDYAKNVRRLAKLARARGQRVIFLTQPTLYQDNMPPELSGLLSEYTAAGAHTPEVLRGLIDAYNRCLLETCAEMEVECLNLADKLPRDTSVFYDDCHFNRSGCRQVSQLLLEFLTRPEHRETSD